MAIDLGHPTSEEDLYLARGGDVEPYRPVIQADVFRGVPIPGVQTQHELALVAAHPCVMRAGAGLRPTVQMISVVLFRTLSFEQ